VSRPPDGTPSFLADPGVSCRHALLQNRMSAIGRVRCPNCATEAGLGDRFCSGCGTVLGLAEGPEGQAFSIDLGRFFDLAVDVFVVTGPDGRFELVNAAMSRLLGVEREDILSRPWSDFVHPDDRERSAVENAREFAEGHRTITFENRYVDVRGGIHWMDWSAELDPETGVVYGIARDVTEQRAAREALEEARGAADEARTAAETANRAKSEFLSRMSHELRTPLNAVLGFGQLLKMDALDSRQTEYVDQILRGGRHLLELIDEVLDISRIEAGVVAISVEPVSVVEAVAEVANLLGSLAAARPISLNVSLGPEFSTHVLADRQRLRQVLVNFLSNAIKYTPPGSTATISAVPTGDGWLRITVSDDGPGIPEALRTRLFMPFERIGAEQTGVEGTGLGLAHSKALVERMGGRIGVESAVGSGTTFWAELRVADPASAVGPAGADAGLPESRVEVKGSLLYIEDNPSNLRLVERAIDRRPGISLVSAMLGRTGLELARQHRPDLILLDLNLPDIGGDELLTDLLTDPRTRDIPVVILSADATRRQLDRLLAMGAHAYLTKPLDISAFLAMLDEHLGVSEP
jgi:PAS domain S-box-containing protein